MAVYYSNLLLREVPPLLLGLQKLRDKQHLPYKFPFHTILRTQTSSVKTKFRYQMVRDKYALSEKDILAAALNSF